MTADTPRGLQPFQPSVNPKITSGKPFAATDRLASAAPASKADLNLELRRNIYEANGKDVTPGGTVGENGDAANVTTGTDAKALEDSLKEPPKQVFCNTCAKDCTRIRYHNSKSTSTSTGKAAVATYYDICPACYLEGRFPSNTSASDYTKLENENYTALPDRDRAWSDAETLLLLEGLELFDDDWSSVAEHVGTRTREQCVLKFLQLEIEDPYLAAEPAAGSARTQNLAYLGGSSRVPFSQADNPVMSVVSFLAGAVDPNVAAAAAGRSVNEMRRTLREKVENGDDNVAAAAESTKTEHADSMDVDPTPTAAPSAAVTVQPTSPSSPPSNPAATALALSAARASAFATHEERQTTALLSAATNLQLRKLGLKLSQFAELEGLLQAERRDLERRRRELFLERLAWRRRVEASREGVERGVKVLKAAAASSVNAGAGEVGGGGAVQGLQEGLRVVLEALQGVGLGEAAKLMVGRDGHGHVDVVGAAAGVDGFAGRGDEGGEEVVRPYADGDVGFRSHEI